MNAVADLPSPPVDLLKGATLFLDFDGTLVDIAPRPDAVIVTARLRDLLERLGERLPGRLALISGRSVEQIRALIGQPAISVSGSHGLEIRWADGRARSPDRHPRLVDVVDRFRAEAETRPGLLVEEKPFSAALHYRLAPEAEQACHALARTLADETGLHLQTGKMMVELRPPGADKGVALRALAGDAAMAGSRPVFLGDDDTDEPAMAAAAELGGAGVLVGPPRPTHARYRLAGVDAVLDWLEHAADEPGISATTG